MAGTDLIENVILFTRLCERPSDELRPAGFRRDCLVQDCTFARAPASAAVRGDAPGDAPGDDHCPRRQRGGAFGKGASCIIQV